MAGVVKFFYTVTFSLKLSKISFENTSRILYTQKEVHEKKKYLKIMLNTRTQYITPKISLPR